MNSVFSVDDFSPPFWQATASAINRSQSEWELDNLLEQFPSSAAVSSSSANENNNDPPSAGNSSSKPENVDDDVVEIKKPEINHHPPPPIPPQPLDRELTAPIDTDEYRAFLKSKLDLACAVVAMHRGTSLKRGDFATIDKEQRMVPSVNKFQLGAQVSNSGNGMSMGQGEADGGSCEIPALPALHRNQDVPVRQTTSGSSKEESDDDELEGDTETNEHTDPADVKRARRMQSNRESARRSRRRKQAQLNELETQVGQLRDERTSLLTRYTDINQKCDDAAVDNRILRANIETLRAKVKMAEEQVKRVTGLNPMLLPRPNMPNMGMQFDSGQVDASTNASVPMRPNSNQFFHHPVPPVNTAAPHLQRLNNFPNNTLVPLATNPQTDNGTTNVGGMTSMCLTTNGQSMTDMPTMLHVQEQIGTVVPGGALPACDSGLPCTVAKDNKKK